jgi:hypothetical protein
MRSMTFSQHTQDLVQLTQQIAAHRSQFSIFTAQLRGEEDVLNDLLVLSARTPSKHVDSAIREQRNKITEMSKTYIQMCSDVDIYKSLRCMSNKSTSNSAPPQHANNRTIV